MYPLVLASASPRRKELLTQIGLKFEILPSNIPEDDVRGLSPEKAAKHLAWQKAAQVAQRRPQALVIGADTIVVLENEILGKPCNRTEARTMLAKLSGRTHLVITGVALINLSEGRSLVDHVVTRVKMRPLSAQQIASYVATGEPMDKAGSYAIQGIGALLVEGIEGCYTNVVGLPLVKLSQMLEEFGVTVL